MLNMLYFYIDSIVIGGLIALEYCYIIVFVLKQTDFLFYIFAQAHMFLPAKIHNCLHPVNKNQRKSHMLQVPEDLELFFIFCRSSVFT